MLKRWPIAAALLLTALSVGLFATGGHFTADALIKAQRTGQLEDLVELALRRAETEVDNGASILAEVANGAIACNSATLQALRLRVYRGGPVKDIRIADANGNVMCSAYSETLEFDRSWPGYDDMLPGDDGAVRLFRVEQFYDTALGVLWPVDAGRSLIAIMAVDTALFDIMPLELRDHSTVMVELANGQSISDISATGQDNSIELMVRTEAVSDRLPLSAVIRVSSRALAEWNTEAYVPVMVLAIALGLMFGGLSARLATRSEDPISAIDRGIAAREFRPYLQPVFDLRTGRIVGCEMLARWEQPDGTVVPPSRFIELAESSGRMAAITWQMLDEALSLLRPLMQTDKTLAFSFNVSPRMFNQPGFVDDLRRAVSGTRVSYRQVTIELTERDPHEDLDRAAALVDELHELGFRIAIDDVGTGHSGLSSLQQLHADVLKIDKFFVDSLVRDVSAAPIIDSLVTLADQLDMTLIAEGIETREQLEALHRAGVDRGQGYLVSPPVPVHDFVALVEAATRREGVPAGFSAEVA